MLSSEEIRQKRESFRKNKDHKYIKPVSLVAPSQDKTVLFNNSGMQQLVPYLSGKKHPQGKRIYNIQKCIRTIDIDEVGDERHLTMFEMMGNWSLGDYYKKESLNRSVQFLTEALGLDIKKLGCSIFGGYIDQEGKEVIPFDKEAQQALIKAGIDKEKIKPITMIKGEKCDNFRGPPGKIGPCGPCAEFHYDRGENRGPNDRDIGENDRFIEIRNNVFMEYYQDEDKNLSQLSQQNVDTGMGLERLAMILQNKNTIFETDIFKESILTIEDLTKTSYPIYKKPEQELTQQEKSKTMSYRVITDHMRAAIFLIGDHIVPSNEARGYVLRRLIRRAYFHYTKLTKTPNHKIFCEKLAIVIIKKYQNFYPELQPNLETIIHILTQETLQFQKTLTHGEKKLQEIIKEKNHTDKTISGADAFLLYDTFGFPLDLTIELGSEQGYIVDKDGFQKSMKKAKQKAKQGASKKFTKDIDRAKHLEGIPPTTFIGYDKLESENPIILKQFTINGQHIVIFDQTPFYAESGGQTGDTGTILFDDGKKRNITDVKKYEGVFLHFVEQS